jgi:hypothetical protein
MDNFLKSGKIEAEIGNPDEARAGKRCGNYRDGQRDFEREAAAVAQRIACGLAGRFCRRAGGLLLFTSSFGRSWAVLLG